MTMLEVNGMQDLDTGSELVKKTASGTMERSVFANGIVMFGVHSLSWAKPTQH